MIIDRYTKAVFTLIAISLFLIALNPWIAPTKAYAELDPGDLSSIEHAARGIKARLSNIESAVRGIKSDFDRIQRGSCSNSKIC